MDIETYYPEVQQRITMLRDPFEVALSTYFYRKSRGQLELDPSGKRTTLKKELERYLAGEKDPIFSFLPRIPRKQSIEKYARSHFLYIGLFSHLQESADHLALLFGKPRLLVPWTNRSNYDEKCHDLRKEFRQALPKEYELLDFVTSLREEARGRKTRIAIQPGLQLTERRL
jgi:hypothetical protein